MSQPTYSSAAGYIGEQFFTLFFDVALDAANPPLIGSFSVQINGTGAAVSAVEVNSTDKSVKITYVANALTAGDIIEFGYQDPTGGNDVNAIQGLDGTDAATFSATTIVYGGRPGPSAPSVPALDTSSDSGTLGDRITSDNTPTVSGTSEANATVKLYDTDGTTLLGTTTADGSGNWSITSTQLSDASHTLKATQTNNLAQTSALSTGLTLNIDTVANAPTTLAVAAGSDSGTLGDGISNVGTPVITGVSEANATVRLYDTDGSTLLGTATANGSGKWSITSGNLVTGSHTLTAKQTDAAGNVSTVSSGFTYIVDTIGPVGMALSTNSVPIASATNGSTVATLSSTDITAVTYGFAVGNGTIDADNGKFSISGTSLTAAQNLSAGAYHIYLKATDAAGNDAFQIFVVNVTNAPSVSSIVRAGSASALVPASDTSMNYTVTFSESVTGVDISDFTLTPSSTASGAITSISGSGATYTVTVDTLGGDGTLRLDLNKSGTGIKNGSSVDITAGAYTAGETYTLDHTAPSAPSTPAMTAGTDTGVSSSDAITKNTTPVFTGTGEANATVKLYDTDGTTLLGTTTADGSGKWSITSSSLSSGAHTVTVKQTDAAGNVSTASSSLAVSIDTTAPSAPGTPVLSPASDSGTSGDLLTNVVTPVITGTAEANATVKLYDTDGTTLLGTTTADGSGKWSVTSSTMTSGSHTLTVKQTDPAGNVSPASSSLTLNIDTSVPSTPGTPALQTASDSGTLSDGITKITAPTMIGTGTVGEIVTLYDTDGSTVLGTAVVDGSGNWSIASTTLADGAHTVTVKQTNAAGTTSKASSTFNLTIDATAPAAPGTPVLTSGSDSGTLGDGATKFNTPVITGTSEANATVKVYDTDGTTLLGTTTADGSGKWSITSSTLSDGAHTVTVKQTDAAGNVSTASSALALNIDTSAPSAPTTPVLSPASDSGVSGDLLTNVVTPVITGTSEANATVKLYDTDGTTLLGTTTADGSGKWSVTSSTLTSGSHTLTVKQTDPAGNVSPASSSLTLNIDTSVPGTPGTPALQTASDSGTLSDGITKVTAPTMIGTGTVGDTVTLYDTDGSTVLGTAVVDGSGNWSIASSTLTDGVHAVTVKQTNPAGTTSKASSIFNLTIDATAPAVPGTPVLASGSDSGTLGDGATKFNTPVITGTSEANATVKLHDTDGTTLLGTTTADGSGKWSITSSTLNDGAHTVTVKQTDAAGNVSTASSSLALNIDTAAPATPAAPTLDTASDAGASSSDGLTNVATPVFSGTSEANATVKLYDTDGTTLLGTTTADGSGKWSVTSSTLTAGAHSLTVKATDVAGNVSTASSATKVTIDSTAPALNGAITVSDTALKIGDTATVTFTFTEAVTSFTEADVKVANGALSGLASSDGGITWTATLTPTASITDTTNLLTLDNTAYTDMAGNAGSGTTDSPNYTVDTVRPVLASSMTLSDTALKIGDTSTVTITFNEAVTGFTTADVTAPNGTLSNLSSGDGGITWTATYTPNASANAATNVLVLDYSGVSDLSGNAGSGTVNSPNYAVDTLLPTVSAFTLDNSPLTSAAPGKVTLTFSEAVTGVSSANVTLTGGKLGNLSTTDGGVTWTGSLSPDDDIVQAGNALTLNLSGIADTAGNAATGSATSSKYDIDTSHPTGTVSIDSTALKAGQSATVHVAFSQAVPGFSSSVLKAPGLVLGNASTSDGGLTWSMTATPAPATTSSGNSITFNAANIKTAAGNAGVGTVTSSAYAVDSQVPTATLALSKATLTEGEQAEVTITFSEVVSGFDLSDLTAGNATLSGLASNDGGRTWKATLTGAPSTTSGANTLALNLAGVQDTAGNSGAGSTSSPGYKVTPSVLTSSVSMSDALLGVGESALVTIAFSHAVNGFGLEDIAAPNGSLSELASADGGKTWTVKFTPTTGSNSSGNTLSVNQAGVTMAITGKAGAGTSSGPSYSIDSVLPQAAISLSDTALSQGETATITVAFSEAVTGFDSGALATPGGSVGAMTSSDGGKTWTGTFTPVALQRLTDNVVTLNGAAIRDAAGNTMQGSTSSLPYLVDTQPAVVGTVDGVTTVTTGGKDAGTGLDNTFINVPIITTTRSDDPNSPNQTLADIPLGQSGTGGVKVDLTVSLPVGAGMQVEGANQLLNKGQALLDLINRIEQKTPSGSSVQQEMTGQGRDFLQALSNEQLESKTLVPTANSGSGNGNGANIIITGNSSGAPGETDGAAIGLVIDTRQLPTNAQLTLNNVDFAAIVGNATLRGGDGRNFVVGDSASQNIFLGADDDLLFGGAGNDIIGSAGGNDTLDGGADNDKVIGGIGNDMVSGGSGNDILGGGRSDAGQWQVFLNSAGKFVAKHETALFAPGQWETVQASELAASLPEFGFLGGKLAQVRELAQLYDAAFDRPADFAGLSYWVGTGSDVLAMAGQFLQGAEWRDAGGAQLSDAAFVAKVYQQALDRAPEAAGAAYWTGLLGNATLSRAEVLKMIALSPEHAGLLSNADGMKVAAATVTAEQGWITGGGDDTLNGGAGNDILSGGDGVDTIVYAGKQAGYRILVGSDGVVKVQDTANGDLDTLRGIERAQFSDGSADISFTQASAASLKVLGLLYQTTLDRASDVAGLKYWIDTGLQGQTLVQTFTGAPEYIARYGSTSDVQFVHALFQNSGLQGQAAGGEQAWVDYLAKHSRVELIGSWIANADVQAAQFGSDGVWLA